MQTGAVPADHAQQLPAKMRKARLHVESGFFRGEGACNRPGKGMLMVWAAC